MIAHALLAAIQQVETPTAAGFSGADLIGIVAIIVSIFGLLLTAIGVLVIFILKGIGDRQTRDKAEHDADMRAIWAELSAFRTAFYGYLDRPVPPLAVAPPPVPTPPP